MSQILVASQIFWRILWPAPYSLLGLAIGGLGVITGGNWRFREGAIECYGGLTGWFVRHLPLGQATVAITLGHVILGQTDHGLRYSSVHERVHVRQFERWGLLMGPAYLLASLWMWCNGRRAYRDNPFEVEAYDQDDLDSRLSLRESTRTFTE